jgi:hypothetical protein
MTAFFIVTTVKTSNLTYEKCCSQSGTYFKKTMAFRKAEESPVCSDTS